MKSLITILGMSLVLNIIFNFTLQSQNVNPVFENQIKDLRDENGNPFGSFRREITDTTETDAIQQRVINGYAASDNFGYCVSGAGDVNGDGYQDILAGAPFNDFGATDGGRVYIYFGGAVFNSAPDVILTGTIASGWLGNSADCAGDVNGDGYDDVIAGSMGFSSFTGRAFIYYGGTNMNTGVDVTLQGETAGDEFGRSVAGAGDFNGDGFADVIVGAQAHNSVTGKAYIFFGGQSMNSTADITMPGHGIGYGFGYSVSSAGDMNGDGFADVIVGSPSAVSNIGRGYLFLGGASPDSVVDLIFPGSGSGSTFGHSVSDGGDINNDGFSDVVVGAPGYSSGTGRAYVYYGGSLPNAIVDVTITGEASGNSLGYSVSSAGDLNGDSYSDIIVGAPNHNSSRGRVYLFKGNSSMDNAADKYFSGENAADNFGASVACCGDVNGDSYPEIIAGAYNNDINGSGSGRAYIYFEKMSGYDTRDLTFSEGTSGEFFGRSVSPAGDVNGDGYDDVLIGNYNYNASTGRAYIYYGGLMMNTTADVTFTGETVNSEFGFSLSSAGDVNADGFDDVIIGAPEYNSATGRAYIYYGGSSMNNTADVIMTGEDLSDKFGGRVANAKDMNADGFDDVIVSASYAGSGSAIGRVYLFLGGSSMNNVSDVTFIEFSTTAGSYGQSVSSAGDFNGDGYFDMMVSHPSQNSVFVYYGESNIDNSEDLIIYGINSIGTSISEAGDFNGDGYDDIIINDFDIVRKVFLYEGGIFPDNNYDLEFSQLEFQNENFGSSVSFAGDLNNDGFSDILIGDNYFAQNNEGRGYAYYGGPLADVLPDLVFTGDTTDQLLGPVRSAGDVNNDGIDDVLNGMGGRNKTYLYISSPPKVSPAIYYSKDVPFDQGGKVLLKWNKSAYDILGGYVTSYMIERSVPPGASGFSWEPIGTIPAAGGADYSFTANTLNDSMSGNSGTTFYQVTALTSDSYVNWRSNIISTYSVDNLAPFAPQSLSANANAASVSLDWDQNLEGDLHHYIIYRNSLELTTTVNSDHEDESLTGDSVYSYQVAAVDIHGNVSAVSDTANVYFNNSGHLNLKVIMEGFYIPVLDRMMIDDTVTVNVRNSISPYSIVESGFSVIDAVTFAGSFEIQTAPSGNYYISVTHRNTIETWSAAPVSYTAGNNVNYDFNNSVTQAFGNNMVAVNNSPVRTAIYSGDENQDGIVDLNDVINVYNEANNFATGYNASDMNGDNVTDLNDLLITYNNSNAFVSVRKP